MRVPRSLLLALPLLCAGLGRAEAQVLPRLPLAVEARIGAGLPVGGFASRDPGIEAEAGIAFSAGAVLDLASWLGVYGEYQWGRFGCAECRDLEESGLEDSVRDIGFEAGARVLLPTRVAGFAPWLRAGALRHQLTLTSNDADLVSEPGLGFALGAGLQIPLAQLFLTPGVHYRSYPASFEFSSPNLSSRSTDVTDLTFDLGLALHF